MKNIKKWFLNLGFIIQVGILYFIAVFPLAMAFDNNNYKVMIGIVILFGYIANIIGRLSEREKRERKNRKDMCSGCVMKQDRGYAPVEVVKVHWDSEETK